MGQDPIEVYKIPCLNITGLLLTLDTIVTAVCLFSPVRVCIVWPMVLFCPGVHLFAWFFYGSPNGFLFDVEQSFILCILATFALLGKRKSELQERHQFARLRGLTATVSNLRENVSQLEAHIGAMQALMGTVCDVVFEVDSELQVVGLCDRLEKLFGPMQNHKLTDHLADDTQLERFNGILTPWLASRDAAVIGGAESEETGAPALLTPPVVFRAADRKSVV